LPKIQENESQNLMDCSETLRVAFKLIETRDFYVHSTFCRIDTWNPGWNFRVHCLFTSNSFKHFPNPQSMKIAALCRNTWNTCHILPITSVYVSDPFQTKPNSVVFASSSLWQCDVMIYL